MGELSSFIKGMGLIDIPCKGKSFSWGSGDGKSKSLIERFLMLELVMERWGVVGQVIGQRDMFDHCPVWLTVDKEN